MNLKPLAKILVQKPKTILLIFTIITLLIGMQASNVYMVSDFSTFLPQDNPTIQLWEEIRDEFKIGTSIIVYVEADDIRKSEVLKEMDSVSSKVNTYKHDEGKQDGIISARSLASLIKEENSKPPKIGDLGGTGKNKIPEDEDLIYTYIQRNSIQNNEGQLFTNNYDVAVIVLQLTQDADQEEILNRTENAIQSRGTTYSKMTITGTLAMQQAIKEKSMEQLTIIFPIALILLSAVLFFFHRSFKGIIIAFLPPAFSLALTFGVLGIVHPQLTLISISIVALLMGLGVDYSIHLMNRFAEEKSQTQKIDRIEKTLKTTGKAVFLSTITTMIGFGSLMISSMSPIVVFGFACAIGILFCFISAILLVPSLVLLLKFEGTGKLPRWIKFAKFAIRNKKRILAIAIFFAVMSIIVIPQVETDVNYYKMAPEGVPEIKKLQDYSEKFGGGANFNALIVETDPQGLTHPEVIKSIYQMEKKMEKQDVEIYSVIDEIKEINEIVERNELIDKLSKYADAEQVIYDRIAERGLVNENYSKTLVIVSIPIGKSIEEIETIVNNINQIAKNTTISQNGEVSRLTGQDAVNVAINKKLMEEQIRSMIIALLLVLAALIIIFNSSIYAVLTIVPVVFVLLWEPGFLVALDIPLSVVTISIASIMIGIGIDYGVHVTHRVREGLSNGLSREQATKVAIEKTGLSLVEAASTTTAGLAAIYFVNIPALQEFGLVVIFMTAVSCIAATLILPVFYGLKFVK